jgi:hypothetical protein
MSRRSCSASTRNSDLADPVASLPAKGPTLLASAVSAAPAAQAVIELAQQPPASVLLAATLAAVVVGRGGNGALLLRTDYGTLALKTGLALSPGSRLDLKLLPGPPPAVMLLHIEEAGPQPQSAPPSLLGAAAALPGTRSGAMPAAAEPLETEAPPAQLDIGTEIEATLTALPQPGGDNALPVGTRLLLRLALAPAPPLGTGAAAAPAPAAPNLGSPPSPTGAGATLPVNTAGTGAPGASFTGTIIPPAADTPEPTVVATPLGLLTLDKQLALPPGTVLALTTLRTAPPHTTFPTPDAATVVAATVISSGTGTAGAALAPGTRLMLRVMPLPPAGGNPSGPLPASDLAGTVIASNGNDTVIETPVGVLALERRLALPPGTSLALQRLAADPPEPPAETPLPQRSTWPALEETLGVLDRAAPELALRLRNDLSPSSAQQLAGTLLFLMSAVSNGTWPGNRTLSALDAAGRRDLRARLEADGGELRQVASDQTGDWRVFVLPLIEGGAVRPVRLYLRRRSVGGAPGAPGARFVLDLEMSRLGALQLDGLVRNQRFDLVLRSHRPITAEMRQEIAELFRNASSAAGLSGDIIFTTASRFAVAPLEALRGHIGVTA